eukprot:TRINITY_DN24132_c0_g1_i1.p1 TRINITY_DN24132_c0_g1~~TRINITY_DN24132_c0_g1_i1.p1  ORF type:complete len:120 (-),score=56.91 TRINITY_DN24132_c0_g1_i1:120-479(-)
MSAARPTVYFHRVCPFAQRAMIMVHEAMHATADPAILNVKEVSLNDMPTWYAGGINRRETLPGLKFPDGTSYPESLLIAKYIDTAYLAPCLLYTSDAADEEDSVDLGGRRIIKKKKKKT